MIMITPLPSAPKLDVADMVAVTVAVAVALTVPLGVELMNGWTCPRDTLLVVGNEIIEDWGRGRTGG